MSKTKLVTIIGRGHSGTRIPSAVLHDNGIFMGKSVAGRVSKDTTPAKPMYETVRYMNKFVKYNGSLQWDISHFLDNPPDRQFETLIRGYLRGILAHNSPIKGWKIPETTFTYPWLTQLFPNAFYIIWDRHPYDSVLSPHVSDKLERWGIPYEGNGSIASYKYQYDLIKNTPTPKHLLRVKYEDFCLRPQKWTAEISKFIGHPLKINPKSIKTTSVNKWKTVKDRQDSPVLRKLALDLGYETR